MISALAHQDPHASDVVLVRRAHLTLQRIDRRADHTNVSDLPPPDESAYPLPGPSVECSVCHAPATTSVMGFPSCAEHTEIVEPDLRWK